jgi:hypothetical protein
MTKCYWEYKKTETAKFIKIENKLDDQEIAELAKKNDWYSYRVYSE